MIPFIKEKHFLTVYLSNCKIQFKFLKRVKLTFKKCWAVKMPWFKVGLFCFVLFFKQARIYAEKRGSSMKGSHL